VKRIIGAFVLGVGLAMFILPQVLEQFKPEPEGMYLVIASVCVGLLLAGLVGRSWQSKAATQNLTYNAQRLRLFLAEHEGQSFTYRELENMPRLTGVSIGLALADLGSQVKKGSSKDYKTTYTLKQ
jgi:hypothetical protein